MLLLSLHYLVDILMNNRLLTEVMATSAFISFSDGVLVNKSIIIEEPAQEEQIIGRANYFAHRLAIDAETPLHLQNENTLITNTNNDLNQQDFSIIAATRNITGTRPFDTDLAPDLNNPRGELLYFFLSINLLIR